MRQPRSARSQVFVQSKSKSLAFEVTRESNAIVIACTGSAETESLDALHQALGGVHDDALRNPVPTVIADIRGLEFATSSCLKVFVTWLQRVLDLDEAQRYQIVFRANPRHSWQRRSLVALAAFATDIVRVEQEAA